MKQGFYSFIGTIIFEEDKTYSIYFNDIKGCFSNGTTLSELVNNAKESLGGHLYCMENENIEIPKPTLIENIKLGANEFTIKVEVYMPVVRNELNQKSVKKTVTLPSWLNDMAMRDNINFSQVLQTALKEMMNLEDRI